MDDLPGSLRLTSAFPFVGRSAELHKLRDGNLLAPEEPGLPAQQGDLFLPKSRDFH